MALDLSVVGWRGDPVTRDWTSKDALLYAVGVGAGVDDLAFTTENTAGLTQRALPTMAVVLDTDPIAVVKRVCDFDPTRALLGELALELHAPLPVEGAVQTVAEVAGVADKTKGALVSVRSTSVHASTGAPLFTVTTSLFLIGEGGFAGGSTGATPPKVEIPDRPADHTVDYETRVDQPLIYRLSGDRYPLHSDPEFAKAAGFPRPIMHGMCTYGFTGRALLAAVCECDVTRFGTMSARFSAPVFPGEGLVVSIWLDGDGAVFQTRTEDGRLVLDGGRFSTRQEERQT